MTALTFHDAIRAAGLEPPVSIEPGKRLRFPGVGKGRSNKAGWCMLFPDGEGGCYGDWSSGLSGSWQARKATTQGGSADFKRRFAEAKAQADAERRESQTEAATKAARIWQAAQPATDDHPYLARKGIKAHGARLHEGTLTIPVRRHGGLRSLQFIPPHGKDKLFLTGGQIAGCYSDIGAFEGAEVLCVAEGFATGATIHEATGYPVAVAFSAGNLEPVAQALRARHPDATLILCADDDAATSGNPGLTSATAAARAVGGLLAVPAFGVDRPDSVTDFNDMAAHCGIHSVQVTIGATLAAPTPKKPDERPALDTHLVSFDGVADWDAPLPHFVDKWLPEGEVTLMAGHGGKGKSFVALVVAVHVALGKPFAGLETTQASVLFYSAEDGKRLLRQRLFRICAALQIDVRSLEGKLHLLDASDLDPALHREQRGQRGGQHGCETRMLEDLAELVTRLDAGLVVIDNASDAYDDDEIKRSSVRTFIRSLRSRIARPGRAVLLLAHINKASASGGPNRGTEDYSGSTAWHNSVRSRLSVSETDLRTTTVHHAKANLGMRADPVLLEWQDGVPLEAGTCVSPGDELARELVRKADEARDVAAKDALIELIRRNDQLGERISTSLTGPSTAYKVLKDQKGFPKGVGRDRLITLLRQLQEEGRLYRRTVRTLDRKYREVFTCATEPRAAPMPTTGPREPDAEQGQASANEG